MITYGTHASKLIANGYMVTPIIPCSKKPAFGRGWQLPENLNPDPAQYKNCGIGIACGVGQNPVYAIDIDVTDNSAVSNISTEVMSVLGNVPVRVGNAPKQTLIYRGPAGYCKVCSKNYSIGKIERLGKGQQFVAFGIHEDTKAPYTWPGPSPIDVPVSSLPEVPESFIASLNASYAGYSDIMGYEEIKGTTTTLPEGDHFYDPNDPLCVKDPIGLDLDKLKTMVNVLDPDCRRDMWRNVGFAIHHETDGSAEGLALWDAWSARGSKYKTGETEYQWGTFGRSSGEPLTAAYIIKLSKEKLETTLDEVVEVSSVPGDYFKNLDWSTTRFIDNPPSIEMVVYNMLPKGITSLLYSAGGAGKSTFLLSLAARIAAAEVITDLTFFGKVISGGQVVILTAEDPDVILNQRYIKTVEVLAEEVGKPLQETRQIVDTNLKIWSTFGHQVPLFALNNDKSVLKTTKYFSQLVDRLNTLPNLQLIIVDTKTRYSPAEGEGNVLATQEVTFYEEITQKTGATVMLLHHSRKSSREGKEKGATAFRDATALFDSVRAAWYMRAATDLEKVGCDLDADDDVILLENSKNNYISHQPDMFLKREGYKYTQYTAAKKVSKEQQKETQSKAVCDGILYFMQNSKKKDFIQGALSDYATDEWGVSRKEVYVILENMVDDGFIEYAGSGSAKVYKLSEIGKTYNLTIEGDLC